MTDLGWAFHDEGARRASRPTDPPADATTAATLPVGPAGILGAIETPGDADWYRVDLVAGATYRVSLRGAGGDEALGDAVIRGVRRANAILPFTIEHGTDTATGATIRFVAAASGTHHIDVAGAFGDTGHYALSIERVAVADAGADRFTQATVTVDAAPVESAIDRAGDVDWHRVVLEAGRTYRIEALGAAGGWGSLGDPRILAVHDARGTAIAGTGDASSGLGTDARIAFAPRESGTYFVAIDDGRRQDVPGSYRVSVRDDARWADVPADASTLAEARIGGSVLGRIDDGDDVDWFRAALLPGRSYRIELKPASGDGPPLPDPMLRGVFDATGRLIQGTANDDYGDGPGARATFTSPGGTLFVAAASADTRGGTYRLAITDVTPPDLPADATTTASIAANAVRTGRVEVAGDRDWFRATLSAGQTYAIALQRDPSSVQPLENPLLHGLFDADGRAIAGTGNDDWGTGFDARFTFTAPKSGTYFISAGGTGPGIGDYVLSLARVAPAADAIANGVATTATIGVGDARTGRIDTPFDEDWYRVRLIGGERYAIDLRGSASGQGTLADPRFAGVFDAAGRLVPGTPNDDAPGTRDSHLVFAPTTSGTYYLAAAGHGALDGTYRLSIARAASPPGGDVAADATTTATVSVGGSYAGAIERGGDVDWVRLRVEAGRSYVATLRGDGADGAALADGEILGVFGAGGLALQATIQPDIADPASRDARAVFAPTSTGDAFVAVRAQDGGTGAYRLAVERAPDISAPHLIATTPRDGAQGIAPGASLGFVFDEPVRAGSGAISIAGGGATLRIDATDRTQVRFDGATMTLTPHAPLAAQTGYSVTLAPGSVEDFAGNRFGGTVAAPLDFATGAAAPPGARDAWTLMVYVAADNDLEPFALRDLNEMESVRGLDAAGINVLAMVDRAGGYSVASGNWTDTRRAQILPDSSTGTVTSLASPATSIGERNMGDPATLAEFIDWAQATAPAQRYALVIWDHGGGLKGAAWDDASNGDRLTIREIRTALDASTVGHFDIVGFDCCQMAMTEMAFALQGRADVFVASQDNEPGDGWAYDRVLARLAGTPNMGAAQLATTIVDTYAAAYAGQQGITLSATDLAQLDGIEGALDRFVDAARGATGADRAALASAATATLRFPSGGGAPWRDLIDFMEEVETRSASPVVDAAARGVAEAVRGAVFAHAGTVPEAGGLSVNLPVGSEPIQSDYTAANYDFLAKVDWNTVLALV
jgi:hypothetical protein